MAFTRITSDPNRMGGVPCIRHLRFPVATVIAMIADGMTTDDIIAEHPDLEPDDITEALKFAALADTDFGELLAHSNADGPSVILLRRQEGRRASEIAALILANRAAIANDLDAGALVVIDDDRIRVRSLPFRTDNCTGPVGCAPAAPRHRVPK